jgi:hypothetical protein
MFTLVSGAIQLTTAAAGKVIETAATAATIPIRAVALIGQTELLLTRAGLALAQAEELIERVAAVATAAESTVAETRAIATAAATAVSEVTTITTRAGTAVDQATAIATRAGTVAGEVAEMVGDYSPTLRQAAPLAARFVSELTPDEVTAAIRMIDELPALQQHLVHDVMPLLGKLDQVGPDLHKLLEVTEDLHLAIAGLPGLKMLRRRGEERVADQE